MSVARPARSAGSGKTGAVTGFVVGLLTGLTLALVVAVYVSRVPVPFMDRGVSRNAAADQAEAERNKNWNPNAALSQGSAPPEPLSAKDPLAPIVESSSITSGSTLISRPATDTVPAAAERFAVQAGAFSAEADAQTQRARLVLLGVEAMVLPAEQNGKTVYRVRSAPVDQRFQAEALQDQLKTVGVETSLVRISR